MALSLTTELPFGATANYWRIVALNLDYNSKTAHCALGLYLSREARESGKQMVQGAQFEWKAVDFEAVAESADPRAIAYEKIKQPVIVAPVPDPKTMDEMRERGETFDPTPVNINPFVNAKDV